MKRNILFILSFFGFLTPVQSQAWQQVPLNFYGFDNGIFFGDTGIVLCAKGICHTNDFFNTFYIDSAYKDEGLEGGLSFSDRYTGYLTDNTARGGLLKTTDGGNTWQAMPSGFIGSNWGNLLIFTNSDTAYATSWDDYWWFYYTYDAGSIWHNDITFNNIANTIGSISRFAVFKDSIMYALCSSSNGPGTIGNYSFLRSTDQGKNWQSLYFNIGLNDYADFHFLDDTTVIMVFSHYILKSTNGGVNFDTVMHSSDYYDAYYDGINSISFTSHDTGFVAYVNSVYRTYDAGNTWVKTSFFENDNNLFIYAVSSQKVIVGGILGLYKTETGGGVWSGEKEVENNSRFSLSPNPATTRLLISTNNFNPQTITIYNLNGQQVLNLPFTHEVDIAALPPGVYFVAVTGKEASEVRKLVKM